MNPGEPDINSIPTYACTETEMDIPTLCLAHRKWIAREGERNRGRGRERLLVAHTKGGRERVEKTMTQEDKRRGGEGRVGKREFEYNPLGRHIPG